MRRSKWQVLFQCKKGTLSTFRYSERDDLIQRLNHIGWMFVSNVFSDDCDNVNANTYSNFHWQGHAPCEKTGKTFIGGQ